MAKSQGPFAESRKSNPTDIHNLVHNLKSGDQDMLVSEGDGSSQSEAAEWLID